MVAVHQDDTGDTAGAPTGAGTGTTTARTRQHAQFGAPRERAVPAGHQTREHEAAGDDDIREVSVGQLLSDVTRDLSTLMRQEVELAKAEIKTEVAKAGKGAGMLGGAGFAGYMVALFLSFGLWWGLANAMDTGLAAVIVAIVWLVIGAVLFVVGRGTLRKVNPKPERTVETVKKSPTPSKETEEFSHEHT